jgi:PTS system fructose-specific IIC component
MIGVINDGIDFEAVDNIPVKIVVLLAVPELSLHLQLLSHLTRIFNDETIRSNIISSDSIEKILELILESENNLAGE